VRRLLLALFPFLAADAAAQVIHGPRDMRFQEPTSWASFGLGLMQPFSVRDGATDAEWRFGNTTQYIVSLEKGLSGGASFGVRGAHARVPLTYSSGMTTGPVIQRDADANVSQLLGTLHLASGAEFHTTLELGVGATLYSNFRQRGTGGTLPPSSQTDFTFALGYGFGYAFNPRFSIDVIQDLATALHSKAGLKAGDDSSIRIHTTRLAARFGLGGP
jgi:hypothetical protein